MLKRQTIEPQVPDARELGTAFNFPQNHIFIRELSVSDKPAVVRLHQTSEVSNIGKKTRYGIFNARNQLIGTECDAAEPFADAARMGYVLHWMH